MVSQGNEVLLFTHVDQVNRLDRCREREKIGSCSLSETPLSCACVDLLEPRSMIMTLINGGAHLDFRTRHGGLTPLHRSAMHFRKESIVVSRSTAVDVLHSIDMSDDG